MKRLFFTIVFISIQYAAMSQGCVAIRNNGGACAFMGYHFDTQKKATANTNWSVALNSRYFKSFRHFIGTEEQKERVVNGTEVINRVFATELSIAYQLNQRWSLGIFTPFVSNTRSSMYEHYGNTSTSPNARRTTRSVGLGDIRFAAYYWLLDPAVSNNLNIQAGLGLKLPTGDYRYQEYFWKNDSVKVLGPVDQSIQLGDGGTGITLESNVFYNISSNTSLYLNGFYLLNPREQNGVSTARGSAPAASAILYGSDVMSVPDQYMFRIGGSVAARRLNFSGGLRIEGVPARDLVGGSGGFRRPGFVVSAEPALMYSINHTRFYFSMPVAVVRNRTQSVPDKIRSDITKSYYKGDAAFADYTINFGASISLH